MSRQIHYGVQVEFTVDNVLDGGPTKADIREVLRAALGSLAVTNPRWRSLRDVRIKYLHEATGGNIK